MVIKAISALYNTSGYAVHIPNKNGTLALSQDITNTVDGLLNSVVKTSDILALGVFKAEWPCTCYDNGQNINAVIPTFTLESQLQGENYTRWKNTPKGTPIIILYEGQWVFYGIKDNPTTTIYSLFFYNNRQFSTLTTPLEGRQVDLIVGDCVSLKIGKEGKIKSQLVNSSKKGYMRIHSTCFTE